MWAEAPSVDTTTSQIGFESEVGGAHKCGDKSTAGRDAFLAS